MQTTTAMLQAGTVIHERYRIERLIGHGGMGAVYAAIDQRLNGTVALKQTTLHTEQAARAFEREAQLLANLRHPALPRVSDFFCAAGGQFLVMEYIPGDDLAHLLERRGTPFAVQDVVRWAGQLLHVLRYLHEHDPPVIHRDIKPQNLKLNAAGDIVLLDFGLAKSSSQLAPQPTTGTRSIFGYTPNYAPLEQIQGTGTDARSDLYALAATMHHLTTGMPPVDAISRAAAAVNRQHDPLRPLHELRDDVPLAVSAVVQQALALAASDRPASAVQMHEQLQGAMHDGTFWEGTATAVLPMTVAPRTSSTLPTAAAPDAATLVDANSETQIASSTPTTNTPTAARALPLRRTIQPMPLPTSAGTPTQAAPPIKSAPPTTKQFSFGWKHPMPSEVHAMFWPLLMIGVGVLWMVSNAGLIAPLDFSILLRLWPVFVVLFGANMLTRRRYPQFAPMWGALAAMLVVLLLWYGSATRAPLRTEQYLEPVDGATGANIYLALNSGSSTVFALHDAPDVLMDARVTHRGSVSFESNGKSVRTITLGNREGGTRISNDELVYQIGLNPTIPLQLYVEGGQATTRLDLSSIHLRYLGFTSGAGNFQAILPASPEPYRVELQGGASSYALSVADGATLAINARSAASRTEMTFGDGVAAEVEVSSAIGAVVLDVEDTTPLKITVLSRDLDDDLEERINLPASLQQTEMGSSRAVWESASFATSVRAIEATIALDGGRLTVR